LADKLPSKVQKQIKETIFKKADIHNYMSKGRIENGQFIENLVKDSSVGGVIANYLAKSKIKTYIKDGVLNRYAKDKTNEALDLDEKELIRNKFQQEAYEIDKVVRNRLSLYRLENGDILLLVRGTLIKWETALRKALEYTAAAPGLPPKDEKFHVMMSIAVIGNGITESDKQHITDALGLVNIQVSFSLS